MKRARFLCSGMAILISAIAIGSEAADRPLRVLFIGNSLTLRQHMPFLLEQVARSKGKQLTVDYSASRGGYELSRHAKSPESLAALKSQPWDYVVLQEHGAPPLVDPAAFRRSAAAWHEMIRATGAKTLLYETSRTGDAQGFARPERQGPLTAAVQEVASELRIPVAPVGRAFVDACRSAPGVQLFEKDNLHPSPEGAYLAACVFYAVLFNDSPEGMGVRQLKSPTGALVLDLEAIGERARRLARAAWLTVEQDRSRPAGLAQPR